MRNQFFLLHPSQHQKMWHTSWMLTQVWTPQPHMLSGTSTWTLMQHSVYWRECNAIGSPQWQARKKHLVFLFVWFCLFFFYLGFLSWTFTIHRTAGEGGGYLFDFPYHFHPLHRHLDISGAITAESSPLHIASSWTWTGNLWFPSASD